MLFQQQQSWQSLVPCVSIFSTLFLISSLAPHILAAICDINQQSSAAEATGMSLLTGHLAGETEQLAAEFGLGRFPGAVLQQPF